MSPRNKWIWRLDQIMWNSANSHWETIERCSKIIGITFLRKSIDKLNWIDLNWKLSTSCLNLASSLLLPCFKKSKCKSSRRCFLCSLSIHAMESTIEECTQFQKRCYEAILILYSVCTSSSEKLSNISCAGRRKDKFAYFSHIPPHTLSLWLDFITFPTKSLILKDQQMLFQLGWLFLK